MIYLADADSKLPNLALMWLAAYFRGRGEVVRRIGPRDRRSLWDPIGDVYGSSIFTARGARPSSANGASCAGAERECA